MENKPSEFVKSRMTFVKGAALCRFNGDNDFTHETLVILTHLNLPRKWLALLPGKCENVCRPALSAKSGVQSPDILIAHEADIEVPPPQPQSTLELTHECRESRQVKGVSNLLVQEHERGAVHSIRQFLAAFALFTPERFTLRDGLLPRVLRILPSFHLLLLLAPDRILRKPG